MDLALFEHGEELICCDKEVAKILCGVEVLRGGLLHAARHERVAMVGRRTAVGRGPCGISVCHGSGSITGSRSRGSGSIPGSYCPRGIRCIGSGRCSSTQRVGVA